MLVKQKILSRNVAFGTFGELLIMLSTKVNLLYFLYLTSWRSCLLHLIKKKLFAKNFYKNSNLDDSGISSLFFSSRTNLTLRNISVTCQMVKKVVTTHDSSKAPGLDSIPVVVLKSCETELSYILAALSSECLKESFFPDC